MIYSIETLRVVFRTDRKQETAYYVFDDGVPKTKVLIWARGELQPAIAQTDYDAMLGTNPNIEVYEACYDANDLYSHITSNLVWTYPTQLEVLVVTGLTPAKCKEILWGVLSENEDNSTEV